MKYFNNQEGKWVSGKNYKKKILLENIVVRTAFSIWLEIKTKKGNLK